ncbi:MAG: L-aspartate oxidase [Candidatus Diapherotrites archaeon]|nr:L-aspartate oxidase [Candidatus Diapherotrites archaeon]
MPIVKRFACTFDSKRLQKEKAGLLIAGSGLAGLSAAFHASRIAPEEKIIVAAKTLPEKSSSFKAQGGIACAFSQNDSPEKLASDTIRVGYGLSDKKAVQILAKEGKGAMEELIGMGLEFDKSLSGEIALGLEAAHSQNRVLHIGGDATGKSLTRFFLSLVKERPNVEVRKNFHLLELLGQKGVSGALLSENGKQTIVLANAIIIASGGYSSVFSNSTNFSENAGEACAIARRAGARLQDMEFEQFHPTAFRAGDGMFLVSERVRGEGALLVNSKGERFLENLPGKELAPRDVVARKIFEQISKGEKVFLDVSGIPDFAAKFPSISAGLKERGFRLSGGMIPVEPAAHYSIGGIKSDVDGRTNLQGLFVAGEASCTGLHGANRLASNSLMETIVFGKRAAVSACREKTKKPGAQKNVPAKKASANADNSVVSEKILQLRNAMWLGCGIVRNEPGLKSLLSEIAALQKGFFCAQTEKEAEFHNMAFACNAIVSCALKRRESRGTHYRSDYPNTAPVARHSVF